MFAARRRAGEDDLRFVSRHLWRYSQTRSMGIQSSKVEHLYLHVPFCAAKCNYCAFYSEAGSAAKMEDYVAAVLLELDQSASELAPKTIFFGGGTPSLLPAPLMGRILESIGRARWPSAPIEWTIECNPSTVSS